MREARSIRLAAVGVNTDPSRSPKRHRNPYWRPSPGRSMPLPRFGGGVRFNTRHTARVRHVDALDALLPLLETVLQTAGYLVLTIGAVALLFHFAP